jgi:hypothetical protein
MALGPGWMCAAGVPRAPSGDAALRALRTRLGDAPFEEAWAEGWSLGGQQAVQDALDEGQPGAASGH